MDFATAVDSASDRPSYHEADEIFDADAGLDIRTLPKGTFLTVDTRNSRYRLILEGDAARHASIRGGTLFPEDTTARVVGSTAGGSRVRLGWIGPGLRMELGVGGQRVVTSRVLSVTLEGPIRQSVTT